VKAVQISVVSERAT